MTVQAVDAWPVGSQATAAPMTSRRLEAALNISLAAL